MHLRIKKLLLGALSLTLCLSCLSGKALQVKAVSTKNLYTGKTYTHDSRFDGYTIYNGIDVSKYQGVIDWNKVKASGVDYAFIRCGYSAMASGTHYEDWTFQNNIQKACDAGIKLGIYYFSQSLTEKEAISEAEYTLSLIDKYNYKDKITLPIVYDFEYGTYKVTQNGKEKQLPARANKIMGKSATVTKNALAFLNVIENAGYEGMYYGNPSDLNGSFSLTQLKDYPCWLARYNNIANFPGDYTFWQYSSSGKVNGITGNVDMNFYYAKSPTDNYIGTPPSQPVEYVTPITVSKVKGFKQLSNTSTTITLSWTRNTSADGYEIYRSNSPNGTFSKVKTITNQNTTRWKNSARSKSRQYYYKIRAYKKADGITYYSSDSSVITGHTNKYIGKYRKTKVALNVRSYPGTAYKKVATLSKNKRVKLLYSTKASNGITWYKISWSGKTGYVCGTYLKKA